MHKSVKRPPKNKVGVIFVSLFMFIKLCFYPLPATFQAEGVLSLPASVRLSVCKLYIVRTITRHRFELAITKFAPSMHPGILSTGIENGGHWPWPSRSFDHFESELLEIWLDNSFKIWARITKFAPKMHLEILSAGIENGSHWPWPSSSFCPLWVRILENLAW